MGKKGNHDHQERTPLQAAGFVSGIGIQFAALILLSVYMGREADARLHTEPWGIVLGSVFGFLSGIWITYKKLLGKQ